MSYKDFAVTVLIAASLLTLAGCGREPAEPVEKMPPVVEANKAAQDAWNAHASQFVDEYLAAQPAFAVSAGRHEFDGKMPDLSKAGIEKEIARLRAARTTLEGISPEPLTEAQRFEREHLFAVIDGDLFWLERAQLPFTNPAFYIGRLDPQVYLTRQYAPLEKRLEGYIGYAQAIPAIAANVKENLRTPLPKSYVERGVAGFGGFATFYRNEVPKVFADVRDPELQKSLATANEAAAKSMEDLKKWFEGQRKTASNNYALGAEVFTAMLKQTEGVDISLEELAKMGRADLDRNLAALKDACAQFLPKGSIVDCIAKMNANKPKAAPVAAATEQLKSLKAFLIEKNLVTIPGTEEALVDESPPYNRGNAAYINIPGPFESGLPSTYYITPPDPSWSAAERAAYISSQANLLFTSAHEVWPGHFLQFLHMNRNPSKSAALWYSYANTEGWAHYTEELMWEAGLGNGDPEIHIAQLVNALLRNVRFVSALGLHTQGMSLEESEKLFRDSAYSDAGNARQQAARGTYDPGYLNYTLGKLMIRKLRADWTAKQPGADDPARRAQLWHDFHDKFLSYGGPTIPLIRKAMLGDEGTLF